MERRDIIVIGASAGGVEALMRLCGGFPRGLRASVFIAQHTSPTSQSVLPQMLSRAGPLKASLPTNGEAIAHGRIYIAPPDRHLLLRPGHMLVSRGPHENRTRPALDPLFRSAAVAYGGRVIGVVLTGLLDDGTNGLICISRAGGTSVAQDPADASWPSMPRQAIERDHVEHVVPLDRLAELLVQMSRQPARQTLALPASVLAENEIAARESAVMSETYSPPGQPSPIGCPQCGGVLNEINDGDEPRFRCQIGHAFTSLGLQAAQSEELERALGVAIRTHRDRLKLFKQLAQSAAGRNLPHTAERWTAAAADAEHLAHVLEQAIVVLSKPMDPIVDERSPATPDPTPATPP